MLTSATTCTGGSPTGATLAYDAERRLKQYQDAPTSPSVTAYYLYDGEGNRVQQAVVTGTGTATTTYLPGGVEEVRPDGGITKYYTAGGMVLGLNTATDASGISYLASDGLGSVSESLDGSGGATSQQLFALYGGVRYTNGVLPTTKGFTGQRSDAAVSGLDYYGARYYDPLLGQFASADSKVDGLNRYGYVKGNPETLTDPTGHRACSSDFSECDGGGHGKVIDPGPHHESKPPVCFPIGPCGVNIPGYPPKKGKPDQKQPPQQKHPTQQQIENARQAARDGASAMQGFIDFYNGVRQALEDHGWAALLTPGAMEALKDLAAWTSVLRDKFNEQARWDDSMWTTANVILFQDIVETIGLTITGLAAEVGTAGTILPNFISPGFGGAFGFWTAGEYGYTIAIGAAAETGRAMFATESEVFDLDFG